jgi:hypothetical protein
VTGRVGERRHRQRFEQLEVLSPIAVQWVKHASDTVFVGPQPLQVPLEKPQVLRQFDAESRLQVQSW